MSKLFDFVSLLADMAALFSFAGSLLAAWIGRRNAASAGKPKIEG